MKKWHEKYGKLILINCGVLVGVIVALVLVFEIRSRVLERGLTTLNELQNEFDTLIAQRPEDRDENAAPTLERSIQRVIADRRPRYIQSRAHFLLASLYSETNRWHEAAESYRTIFDNHQRSYLAPVALYNSAVSLEMAGDSASALQTLLEFITRYELEEVPNLPRALFNAGRLYERQNDLSMAESYYRRVVNEHGGSDYVTLAINRLILLALPRS